MAVVSPLSQGARMFYVGSFTDTSVTIFTIGSDGTFTVKGTVPMGLTPTWLEFSGGRIFSTNEQNGAVADFQVDPVNGGLGFISRRPAGNATTHLSVDRSRRFLLAANYDSGSVIVFPIQVDGIIQPSVSFHQHTGHGKDPNRQEGPHAHQIVLDAENLFAFSPDLGVDKVYQYNFDIATGQLTPNTVPYVEVLPGDGPRHMAIHPTSRWAYLACELSSTIITFSYSPVTGRLTAIQRLPATLVPQAGNAPAEVIVLPNGRYVYLSNRGNDSVAIFSVDQATGMLTAVENHPGGGVMPRGMILDPLDRVLYLMNQGSGTVTAHSVDYETGLSKSRGVVASNLVTPVTAVIVDLV